MKHPSSFLLKSEASKGFFIAMEKMISCYRLRASAVQVRHKQEKTAKSLEKDLDIYLIKLQIIVFNSPTALFVDFVFYGSPDVSH